MGKAVALDLVRSSPHRSITLAAIELDVLRVHPRGEMESLLFSPPFENLEAIQTGEGVSRLPQLMEGKVQSLEYKTIR